MKRLILIVLFVSTIFVAQDINISGYTGMSVPTDTTSNEFALTRARVKVVASHEEGTVSIEYGLLAGLQSAYFQADNLLGTTFTTRVGRFLNPMWWSFPGPRGLETIGYPIAFDIFAVYLPGISLSKSFLDNNISAEVAYFGEKYTASVSIYGARATYMHNVGWSFVFNSPRVSIMSFDIGVTKDTESGDAYLLGRAKAELTDDLHFWVTTDQVARKEYDAEFYGSIGLTYVYGKDSFVKCYYDLNTEQVFSEITFAF